MKKIFDDEFKHDINYFNVSCKCNNLTPINADVILGKLNEMVFD